MIETILTCEKCGRIKTVIRSANESFDFEGYSVLYPYQTDHAHITSTRCPYNFLTKTDEGFLVCLDCAKKYTQLLFKLSHEFSLATGEFFKSPLEGI